MRDLYTGSYKLSPNKYPNRGNANSVLRVERPAGKPRHDAGCLDVEGFPLENHWYLVYPAGKQVSTVARAFLDFARAQAKGLVSGTLARN